MMCLAIRIMENFSQAALSQPVDLDEFISPIALAFFWKDTVTRPIRNGASKGTDFGIVFGYLNRGSRACFDTRRSPRIQSSGPLMKWRATHNSEGPQSGPLGTRFMASGKRGGRYRKGIPSFGLRIIFSS